MINKNINTDNDWRLTDGQPGKNFAGNVFELKKYKPIEENNDHDHCEFCFKKFFNEKADDYCTMEGFVTVTVDKKGRKQGHWVCKECFSDFKELLNLQEKNG